jgi:hypothetical protein
MYIDYGINDKIKYLFDVILKEARKEDKLSYQLIISMLSVYSNNPINLLINAPSGVGKNYVINIVSSLFPQSDILSLAGMTDKALFHRSGTLVIKNENGEYESIEDKIADIDNEIEEKEHELTQTNDKNVKQGLRSLITNLNQDKKNLVKDARKLIDLSNKIIIFLDTPSEQLLSGLLPLLSHDKYEIEYEFTDTHNGIKTKNNVLRGWPAVIIAQALDYSKSPRFAEYQRRFITTNPKMTKEKYTDAINLIFDKCSVPDLIYQHEIVSEEEKDKVKEIIKGFKEQILEICSNVKPGKNNVIIPFRDLILQSIPKEKALDMTRAEVGKCGYLWIEQIEKGKWYEILLHVKWSTSSDGFVEGWVQKDGGTQIPFSPYKGVTLNPNGPADTTVYLKQGLYRNSLINETQTLWHDGMVVAKCPTNTKFNPSTNKCDTI